MSLPPAIRKARSIITRQERGSGSVSKEDLRFLSKFSDRTSEQTNISLSKFRENQKKVAQSEQQSGSFLNKGRDIEIPIERQLVGGKEYIVISKTGKQGKGQATAYGELRREGSERGYNIDITQSSLSEIGRRARSMTEEAQLKEYGVVVVQQKTKQSRIPSSRGAIIPSVMASTLENDPAFISESGKSSARPETLYQALFRKGVDAVNLPREKVLSKFSDESFIKQQVDTFGKGKKATVSLGSIYQEQKRRGQKVSTFGSFLASQKSNIQSVNAPSYLTTSNRVTNLSSKDIAGTAIDTALFVAPQTVILKGASRALSAYKGAKGVTFGSASKFGVTAIGLGAVEKEFIKGYSQATLSRESLELRRSTPEYEMILKGGLAKQESVKFDQGFVKGLTQTAFPISETKETEKAFRDYTKSQVGKLGLSKSEGDKLQSTLLTEEQKLDIGVTSGVLVAEFGGNVFGTIGRDALNIFTRQGTKKAGAYALSTVPGGLAEGYLGYDITTDLFNDKPITEKAKEGTIAAALGGLSAGTFAYGEAKVLSGIFKKPKPDYKPSATFNSGEFIITPDQSLKSRFNRKYFGVKQAGKEKGYSAFGYGIDLPEYPGDILTDLTLSKRFTKAYSRPKVLGLQGTSTPTRNIANTRGLNYNFVLIKEGVGITDKTNINTEVTTDITQNVKVGVSSSTDIFSLINVNTNTITRTYNDVFAQNKTDTNTKIVTPKIPIPPLGGGGYKFNFFKKKVKRKGKYSPSVVGIVTGSKRKKGVLTGFEVRGV